jgi:hypothetical protein
MALVKEMHSKGPSMAIDWLESFNVQGSDYRLTKQGPPDLTIEALN